MPHRSLDQIMTALGPSLDEFDQIARAAHSIYRSYPTNVLLDHDPRAQAACTYAHMNAEAARRFTGRDSIRELNIRGLKLWLFNEANVVIRLKKMGMKTG